MSTRRLTFLRMVTKTVLTVALATEVALADPLAGFERSRHFEEQIKVYAFEPNVNVHINAPSAAAFDPNKPTRLVLYALPNGNSTAQTIGKQQRPGVDWHFFIQHIGAQIRRLREVVKDENLVVAYLEAEGKSWPSWVRSQAEAGECIERLIDSVRSHFAAGPTTADLASHSGGGSLIFAYLNHVVKIPAWIGRIVFLDSNYGYSDKQGHGDKLVEWLQGSPHHYLGVIAYDDRRGRVDGKLVVGPQGGTYRKTQRMLERLRQSLPLSEETQPGCTRFRGAGGRIDVIILDNPDNKILHTVLVEKNGLIHTLTFATPHENQAGRFNGPTTYEKWIQPD